MVFALLGFCHTHSFHGNRHKPANSHPVGGLVRSYHLQFHLFTDSYFIALCPSQTNSTSAVCCFPQVR